VPDRGRKGKKSPFIFSSSHIVFQSLNAFDALQYDHLGVSAIKSVQWQRNNSFSLHYDLSTRMMKPVMTSAVQKVMENRKLFLTQAFM